MKSKTNKINKKKNNTRKKTSSTLQKGGNQQLISEVSRYGYYKNNDRLKIIQAVIDAGADVNFINENNAFPLGVASEWGYLPVVKLLIVAGANVNLAVDETRLTGLIMATRRGHVEVVQTLLDAGADVLHKGGFEQQNSIHFAATNGNTEILHLLLRKAFLTGRYTKKDALSDGVDESDPLLTELYAAHEIQYNKNLPSDVKINIRKYGGGMNPPDREFEQAIRDGNIEQVRKDIDVHGFDVNVRLPNQREKAIHMATRRGHLDMVTLLLDRNALINAKDVDDYRPIHHAADRMRLKGNSGNPIDPKLEEKMIIARLLIERGANINVNSAGQNHTPLDLAAREGDLEMVELLVDNGANVNNYKPLQLASQKGYLEIVKYLVEHGANLNDQDIEIRFDGLSPLHEAVRGGHFDVVEYLIEQGADINATHEHYGRPINMIINLDSKPNYRKIAFFLMRRGIEDGTFNEADATHGLRAVYDRIQKEALLEPIIQRTVERQDEINEFAEEMRTRSIPENVTDKYMGYLGGKKKKQTQKRGSQKKKKRNQNNSLKKI